MRKCRNCGVELSEDNTYKKQGRICKECCKKHTVVYLKTHPEKWAQYHLNWRTKNPDYYKERYRVSMREYLRNNVIHTKNKRIKTKKRPRPNNICETCGKTTNYLAYHHWDDEKPWNGVWTCMRCHSVVEAIDDSLIEKIINSYLTLRMNLSNA